MSAKLATQVFWNKGYDVLISIQDVTNKILLRGSYYIVYVVMWPMFSNYSICMSKVNIIWIL